MVSYHFITFEETCPGPPLGHGVLILEPLVLGLRSLTLIWKFWEPVVCFERRNLMPGDQLHPATEKCPGASPAAKLLLSLFPPDLRYGKDHPSKLASPDFPSRLDLLFSSC